MQEGTLTFDKHFINGLRPRERLIRSAPFLYEAQNAIPREEGMSLYEAITDPFNTPPTVAYPFPQLFRGRAVTLLCFENTIYLVTETAGAWTTAQITTYDPHVPADTKAITAGGGVWHFVDYGEDSWFLYNGTEVVFKGRYEEFQGKANKAFVMDYITVATGCTHMGRNIMGGFSTADFWKESWQNFWDYWYDRTQEVESHIPADLRDNIGNNYVWWGNIGGGDALWLFYPELANSGIFGRMASFDTQAPFLFDSLHGNQMGFVPMPFQGDVYVTKPLGKHVIVYGENGVAALTFALEPTPTYGVKHLSSFGINERGAVGGDDSEHLFVDQSGDMWKIGEDLKIERLGYSEYISGLVGSEMLVSHDPLLKDFYISSDSDCFLLTSKGLGEARELVTSVAMAEGGLVGVAKDITGAGRGDFLTSTHEFDMGYRGKKMIQSLSVAVDTADPAYVAVDYRHSKDAAYTRTGFVLLNPEGNAVIPVSGVDFRVVVKVPYVDDTNWYVKPDYVTVHWKAIDKRFMRGKTNANQTTQK